MDIANHTVRRQETLDGSGTYGSDSSLRTRSVRCGDTACGDSLVPVSDRMDHLLVLCMASAAQPHHERLINLPFSQFIALCQDFMLMPPLPNSMLQDTFYRWHETRREEKTLRSSTTVSWATPADLPIELHDNILDFFVLEGGTHVQDSRNYAIADKRALGWICLVCKRWTYLIQPQIFRKIILRSHADVKTLHRLLCCPQSHIGEYLQHVDLEILGTTYPSQPWIHTVQHLVLSMLPVLPPPPTLRILGPLPRGSVITSIHGSLPKHSHVFAAGLARLHLHQLQLLRLGQLVGVIKELPSLTHVECDRITWAHTHIPFVTVYSSSGPTLAGGVVRFSMQGCTDNVAASWLTWLVARSRLDRLAQHDTDALCGIASALMRHIKSSSAVLRAKAFQVAHDYQSFVAEDDTAEWARLTPTVYTFPTPRVPGERRRACAIAFLFEASRIHDMTKYSDWEAIDELLPALNALQDVLLAFTYHSGLLSFHDKVLTQRMPRLSCFAGLKYILQVGPKEWSRVTLSKDGIDDVTDFLAPEESEWIAFLDENA